MVVVAAEADNVVDDDVVLLLFCWLLFCWILWAVDAAAGAPPSVSVLIHCGPNFITVPDMVMLFF